MVRILLTGVLFGAGYKFGTEYVYPWLKSAYQDIKADVEAAKEDMKNDIEDEDTVDQHFASDDVRPVDDK